MTQSDKLRMNALLRKLQVSQSSLKILRDDNERKTKELERLKGLIRAVGRTL